MHYDTDREDNNKVNGSGMIRQRRRAMMEGGRRERGRKRPAVQTSEQPVANGYAAMARWDHLRPRTITSTPATAALTAAIAKIGL